jgi:hypothetical protein
MSCEQAGKRLAEALNAYLRVEKELAPLLLSPIATPERPAHPAAADSEKSQRLKRLMIEQEAAFERYQAALSAFMRARKAHHN